MSGTFESLSRPFATQQTALPSVAPTSLVVPVRNAIINIGRGGSCKTMSGSYNLTVTYYMKKKSKEQTATQAQVNP